MAAPLNILMLGDSDWSILASKIAMAGHAVTVVCHPQGAKSNNASDFVVSFPMDQGHAIFHNSIKTPYGESAGRRPRDVDLNSTDLVVIALSEPRYTEKAFHKLMFSIASRQIPTVSVMNMPPKAYLSRFDRLDVAPLDECYFSSTVWDAFSPAKLTLCSPDPLAFRLHDGEASGLQLTMPAYFKAAAFPDPRDTAMLRCLLIESKISCDKSKYLEAPIALEIHRNLSAPTAQWAMSLAGDYRCIASNGIRSLRNSIHSDLFASRDVYNWVQMLRLNLGAPVHDLISFDEYVSAVENFAMPSPVAQALLIGATKIERLDLLVQKIGMQQGMRNRIIDEVVEAVNGKLETNRRYRSLH